MTRYASTTTVPADRTVAEIEKTLLRFGATRFGYMLEPERVMVAFEYQGLRVRMDLPLPGVDDQRFTRTPTGRPRSRSAAGEARDQHIRSLWRSLHLLIKAKLAAVEAGIATFEVEFLSHVVLPEGDTVAQRALPAVYAAIESGRSGPLLLERG